MHIMHMLMHEIFSISPFCLFFFFCCFFFPSHLKKIWHDFIDSYETSQCLNDYFCHIISTNAANS